LTSPIGDSGIPPSENLRLVVQRESQAVPASKSLEVSEQEGVARLQRVRRLRVLYPRLERLCKPQLETFWVLGGRPGAFKTTVAWNLALNAAQSQQRVLFVSLEMTPAEMAVAAVTRYSGIPRARAEEALVENSQYPFSEEEKSKWQEGLDKFLSLRFTLRIHGAENGRNIGQILESARAVRYDGVFVDHLGMIGRGAGPEMVVLAAAIDRLRALSRGEVYPGYRPWVVATSQLNREIDKAEEERPPRLADFRGSARIEHDADVAIGLVKRRVSTDENDPRSYVDGFLLKNRQGPAPEILLWEANGATGFVTERTRQPEQQSLPQTTEER